MKKLEIAKQTSNPGLWTVQDDEINALIERKKREWERKGVSEDLQNMAFELATSWAEKMADFHVRTMREVGISPTEEQTRRLYLKFLQKGHDNVAENWISRMIK